MQHAVLFKEEVVVIAHISWLFSSVFLVVDSLKLGHTQAACSGLQKCTSLPMATFKTV